MLGNQGELERFAREHHLHYDVRRELVDSGEKRESVEFDLRLFASHAGARLPAPGCEKCVELAAELASFARELMSGSEVGTRTEVVPAAPALYESTEERDTDEVALMLRVRCESPGHRTGHGGDDPCTRELRDRLAAVGVRRT